MTENIQVLYVENEHDPLKRGKAFLEKIPDFTIITVSGVGEALRLLRENSFDLVISDHLMPSTLNSHSIRQVTQIFLLKTSLFRVKR